MTKPNEAPKMPDCHCDECTCGRRDWPDEATASSDAWLKEQKAKALDEAANQVEEEDEHLRVEGDGMHISATRLRQMAADLRSPESDIDQATRFQ